MKEENGQSRIGGGQNHLARRGERWKRLLRRAWWVPALLGVTAGVGVWVWSLRQPPAYTSYGRMMVNVKLSLPEGSFYTEELSNFMGTQAALMQSGLVVARAHTRVRAVLGTEARLVGQGLRVSVLPKTTIFVLSATGREAECTRLFLQSCMEEYLTLKKEMRVETSDTTLAGLTDQVLRLEKELRQAEGALMEFQSTNSLALAQEQGNSTGPFLNGLHQRLAGLRWEEAFLEEALPVSLGGLSGDVLAPRSGRGQVEEFVRLKQQLQLLKADEKEFSLIYRDRHPKMLTLREEIARRERMLRIYEEQGREEVESRRQVLGMQVQRLSNEINEWEERVSTSSRKAAELTRLRAEVQRKQGLYDRLLSTLQTLDVNKEISPESVTLVENASEALPEQPPAFRNILAGLAVGLLAGVGLLGFASRFDDRIHSAEDLEELFEEPVLAQLPQERPKRGAVGLIKAGDDRHAFLEAFRSLRSSLLFLSESGEPPRTVLMTSSVPGEGKSLITANLGITLGQARKRVLLVDADGRMGCLERLFGMCSGPGLAEVLEGRVGWKEAVVPTGWENVDLLPRGQSGCPSGEIFHLKSKVLDAAALEYAMVLLDSPPVLAADDSATFAPLVEGVVFVMRTGKTSARVARGALGCLYQRQANVLGLVLNGVSAGGGEWVRFHGYEEYGRVLKGTEG